MKKIRMVSCLVLTLLLLLMVGCGQRDEWDAALKAAELIDDITEDPQLRADTERILDAIIVDDYATAWDTIYKEVRAVEFRRMYVELQPILAGIESYELTPASIHTNYKDGVSTVSIQYMMTAGTQRFLVEVARVEGYDGLIAFYIDEYIPVTTTGTIGNMQEANVPQWILLIVGLLELVFVVWTFVDCCCHKMRKKWLWLLVIALGYLVVSLIATPEQFRMSANVGAFLSYTCLIRYSSGGFTLRVMIPVGAIIYLVCRKTLFAKHARYQQEKAAPVQIAEQTLPEADALQQ